MVFKAIKTRASPDDELEWIKYGRKLRQDSPDIIDGQAKALVALSTTLLTVYTGALALFKIPDILGSFFPTAKRIWVIGLVILILPIVFWLVSIYLNLNVYQPEAYKTKSLSPNRIKKSLAQIIDAKSKKLKNGMYFFLLALLWSALCIGIISLFSSHITILSNPQDVQFIIPSSSIQAFDSMSIGLAKPDTTVAVKMLEEEDGYIIVQLTDGRKAKFNSTLIQGIIYLEGQPVDNTMNKT